MVTEWIINGILTGMSWNIYNITHRSLDGFKGKSAGNYMILPSNKGSMGFLNIVHSTNSGG